MHDGSAVITGGAQGIGRATATSLVNAGLHVVLLDTDAQAGREAAAELSERRRAIFIRGSADDEGAVKRALGEAHKMGRGLFAAVANAGIDVQRPLSKLTLADWNHVLAVNLTGAFLLAKHSAPLLKPNRGALLLISSTRALMSEENTLAYSASKGGLVALAHALAISLGPEIRVNCISPGWIATDQWQRKNKRRQPKLSPSDHAQHPAGRVGKPEDVAALARFLLSADAGFITGQNYIVDGGMTRKMIYT